MLHGQNIAGSPFSATVTAVEVDAGCSYAAGDGVTAARSGHLVSPAQSAALHVMHRQRTTASFAAMTDLCWCW